MKLKFILPFVCFLTVLLGAASVMGNFWKFPTLPPPEDYGDILMNRVCSDAKVRSVFFSHWRHRIKYSCRVCHFELDFAFANGETEITEEDNQNGLFCGACHDGTTAFGHTRKNCIKCHTGKIISHQKEYNDFIIKVKLLAPFGNKLNWVGAVEQGVINPIYSIYNKDEKPLKFSKKLELQANWNNVPPAYFDHKTHNPWLDCANCHPDIFNIKQKTTKHFSMEYILEKKFCGVCHLRIAFPLDDCHGCHPAIKRK